MLNKVGEGGKNGIIIRRGVSSIRNSRAHDIFFSWTFDLLLVSCSWYLVLGVLKEIFLTTLKKYWKPKLHHAQMSWERNQPWNKNKHFNLFLILILKKPVFQCKIKTPYEFLFFFGFMNTFSETAVRRYSSKLMLLKISQHRCFPVRPVIIKSIV